LDIDVDFETDKRQQVIDYVVNKYKGRAVQICSYGEYNIDNLVNDLAGVCGLETTGKDIDDFDKDQNKKIIAEIKRFVHEYEIEGKLNIQLMCEDVRTDEYNSQYDNIIKHFCKMYGKIRYLGKHAAGVAVVGSDISNYTCMMRRGKDGFSSCYDLNDLEHINCTKFDMLGLKTLSEIKELQEYTGHTISEGDREEQEIYDCFKEGKTDGIFQMEKSAPKKILDMIQCDCIDDVIAVNALNRPAPLQLKMHETYSYNKLSGKVDTKSPYYKYTKETYGTMLYQEQTVEVAQKLGHLTPEQSFDLLKIMKKAENLNKPEYVPIIEQMRKDFFAGCRKEGLTKEQATEIWGSMLIYGFNKGHSTGYALISIDQMWYKIHYPAIFWYVKMKYAGNDADIFKYSQFAVKDDVVVMLPHVNQTALTSMRNVDGEKVIQQGLSVIKGVGEKAADAIEEERKKNGDFLDYDDFYDRCKGRTVTTRVIAILKEQGALEFNEKRYMSRVIKYNSSLLGR
jgi:DNA polymerase-3 subunit alpha